MWATMASVTKTNLCEWLRQDGSLPQSVVLRNNTQGQELAGEETKLLATQRQPTYLVAPASSLSRLHFVVLRLMYVIDIEKLNAVSCCLAGSKKLPSSLSHGQGLLF